MKKQESIYIFLLVFIVCMFQTSCGISNNIYGQWVSSDRDLIIKEDQFEIIFHNSKDIIGFNGTFIKNNKNINLLFLNYKNKENKWISLKNTELENYQEQMTYKIQKGVLETNILNTGKIYTYNKTKKDF